MDLLASSHQSDAPVGFVEWLGKNNADHDPLIRNWDLRGKTASQASRRNQSRPYSRHFYKCPDQTCVHYIYGFGEQDELHRHSRIHAMREKRDSGLSMGGLASLPLYSDPARGLAPSGLSPTIPSSPSPTHLTSDISPYDDKLRLPPLQEATTRDGGWNGFTGTFTFNSRTSGLDRKRSSTYSDVEVDPLLPPLKHNRIGPSRLKSIGELMQVREADACLRCKALELEVCSQLRLSTTLKLAGESRYHPNTRCVRLTNSPIV